MKMFQCTICERNFRSMEKRDFHEQTHNNESDIESLHDLYFISDVEMQESQVLVDAFVRDFA